MDLDLPGYRSPSIVTGESERPDIVITLKDKIYIIELTVGFETRIKDNVHRKKEKYLNLCRRLTRDREVTFMNLTMGAIGIIGKDGKGLYKMLKNLELSSQEISFITNKITGHCIRSTYYLFCMKDNLGRTLNFGLGSFSEKILLLGTCYLCYILPHKLGF